MKLLQEPGYLLDDLEVGFRVPVQSDPRAHQTRYTTGIGAFFPGVLFIFYSHVCLIA
jgi:hypothetical protein